MSKWYEVEVQTLVVYVVEVADDKNERDAEEVGRLSCDCFRRVSVTALPIPVEHVETAKKNADRVRLIDGWDGVEWDAE